jgi:preprotein translocase subunit SecE
MATRTDDEKEQDSEELAPADPAATALVEPTNPSPVLEPTGDAPVQLGMERYVHAAFFAAGVLLAYLSSKILSAAWSYLADWAPAARAVPQLVGYPEEQRDSFTLAVGAVLGILVVFLAYRKAGVRTWAEEVTTELGKVSWPNRETVVNGTIVVVIASTIATVYVAVLDKLWGFVTNLVYGT